MRSFLPSITVIIPCFNPPVSFLQETLESVRRSTFQNYAVLIVNDGSTDPAFLSALEPAQAADPRLQVIHHPENRGLSAARNTGVEHCTTPYFVQLDADDQLAPTFIEKCLWALESHPEWSFCSAWVVGFGAKEYLWNKGFERGADFLVLNQVTATAVIRREADRAIGGHDETIREGCEDWDYWLKMAAHGLWGGTIPEYLICYRCHTPPTYWRNRDHWLYGLLFMIKLRRRYPRLWKEGFPFPCVIPSMQSLPGPVYWYRVLRQTLYRLRLGVARRFSPNAA